MSDLIYVRHKVMPTEAMGDADHLALASFYNCDTLVTPLELLERNYESEP